MNATIDKFYEETIRIRKLSYRAPEADGKKIRASIEALEQLARECVAKPDEEKQAEPA